MFDAIEDIPTEQLIAELERRGDSLVSRIKELEADAARFRWLVDDDQTSNKFNVVEWGWNGTENFRNALDRVMEASDE